MSSAERKRSPARSRGRAGAALRRLVDLVSHRSGLALTTMNEAAITLPQVLLLSHVERRGSASPSELAQALHASLPSVSQMIDRLVQQGLLDRAEDRRDRRRKSLATTADARAFLRKLGAARSMEYELGLAPVPPALLAQMVLLLERVILELEKPTNATPRRATRSPRRTR